MVQKSRSLQYEPSSEPLHISAEQMFLNQVVVKDSNYWNDKHIYPVGFECRRLYHSASDPDGPKVDNICIDSTTTYG